MKHVNLDKQYESVVVFISEEMKKNELPWRKPWFNRLPTNFYTKKPYRGINTLTLLARAHQYGYQSHFWLTQRQAQRLKARIRQEELLKPHWIIMSGLVSRTREDGLGHEYNELRFVTRSYNVYNLEQVAGLEHYIHTNQLPLFGPIARAEDILQGYKNRPAIFNDEARAFYNPVKDTIGMPRFEQFTSPEEYYATLFHELIHSTGHVTRLSRSVFLDKIRFGDTEYAREELIAELGASFLCCVCGFFAQTRKNATAYISSWLKGLEQKPTLLLWAASKAQQAVDYVRGIPPYYTPKNHHLTLPLDADVWERRVEEQ